MIPMLIVYLLKKSTIGNTILCRLDSVKQVLIRVLFLVALFLVTNSHAINNNPINKSIAYKVLKSNKTIGTIKVIRTEGNDGITYKLESDIEARCVLKFHIVGSEQSVYKDGNLVFSSVFRKVNDNVKVNHEVVLDDNKYKVKTDKGEQDLELTSIHNNLVTLYFKEPKNINFIYCDNIRKNAPVQVLGNGKYKVEFSKSKYNIFHYKNGKCIKVEAYSALFDVTLIPVLS